MFYTVALGQTLSCAGSPPDLAPSDFSDGLPVPQVYIDAMEAIEPGRTAALVAVGTLVQQGG